MASIMHVPFLDIARGNFLAVVWEQGDLQTAPEIIEIVANEFDHYAVSVKSTQASERVTGLKGHHRRISVTTHFNQSIFSLKRVVEMSEWLKNN